MYKKVWKALPAGPKLGSSMGKRAQPDRAPGTLRNVTKRRVAVTLERKIFVECSRNRSQICCGLKSQCRQCLREIRLVGCREGKQ